jgi:hypothetical protein
MPHVGQSEAYFGCQRSNRIAAWAVGHPTNPNAGLVGTPDGQADLLEAACNALLPHLERELQEEKQNYFLNKGLRG